MRRPFDSFPTFRLDSLLEEKAKQGVQVYIILIDIVSSVCDLHIHLLLYFIRINCMKENYAYQLMPFTGCTDLCASLQGGFYSFENQQFVQYEKTSQNS
jgi:hypothetical protein